MSSTNVCVCVCVIAWVRVLFVPLKSCRQWVRRDELHGMHQDVIVKRLTNEGQTKDTKKTKTTTWRIRSALHISTRHSRSY